jgi:hypothetical protein
MGQLNVISLSTRDHNSIFPLKPQLEKGLHVEVKIWMRMKLLAISAPAFASVSCEYYPHPHGY